jgi:endonuclease YncB( thermonuclease family)
MTGRVVGVLDGDTISVLVNGREQRVRLAEVDAPEKGQAYGQRSKQSLSDLVYGKTVTVLPVDTDRYGRTVAHVRIGSMDASMEQVRRGMAWSYDQYVKDPNIRSAAAAAKQAKLGLWSEGNPTAPWIYRKGSEGAPAKAPEREPVAQAPKPPKQGVSQAEIDAFLSGVPSAAGTSNSASNGSASAGGIYGDVADHTGPRGGVWHTNSAGNKAYNSSGGPRGK